MAKICQFTGRRALSGNKVSHSNRKTRKQFNLNLQSKKLVNPATGEIVKVRISASALKTLNKWDRAGKQYDLREYITC